MWHKAAPTPPSLRVLICGPDGTGKSTLVESLAKGLTNEGRTVVRHHFSPGIIPKRRAGEAVPVTFPHKEPPRSRVLDTLRILLRWVDFVVGYGTTWRKRRGRIHIVERGWHDQAVDPTRYRSTPRSRKLVNRLGRALPRYDVAILLGGEAATVAGRKGELSIQETRRQIHSWQELVGGLSNRAVVFDSVSDSQEAVATGALACIRAALQDDA